MSEQLKYKIYDHEVIPPARVWNAIVEELDAEHSHAAIAGKIHAYEVAPPTGSWQAIVNMLDASAGIAPQKQEVPVKQLSSRKPLTWMAAAAAVIILFTGGYYFLNNINGNSAQMTASGGSMIDTDRTGKTASPTDQYVKPVPERLKVAVPSYYASNTSHKKTTEGNEEKPLRCSHIEESEPVVEDLTVSITPRQILSESGEPIRDMSVVNPDNNKYISITAPNGQQTRISSKLAIAMPYFGLADQVSKGLQTESSNWKQLIQEWRDKIMHSAFTPSSSNFLDILEFSDLINQ